MRLSPWSHYRQIRKYLLISGCILFAIIFSPPSRFQRLANSSICQPRKGEHGVSNWKCHLTFCPFTTPICPRTVVAASLKSEDTAWIQRYLPDQLIITIYAVDEPMARLKTPSNMDKEAVV